MLSSIPPQILSTESVHRRQRVGFWRDLVCDVFVELDCEPGQTEDFAGKIINRPLAGLQFSEVISKSQHVKRSPRQLARSNSDYFLISLQTRGTGMVVQDGRVARISAGEFALYDTSRPYELLFADDFSQLVVRVPRTAFANRLVAPEWLTARAIDGSSGLGRIALSYLAELDRQLPQVDESAHSRLCETFLDLLSLAMSSLTPTRAEVSNVRLQQLYRIHRFIDDHLADSELSPQWVAQHHKISTRYLNMLFEAAETTPARWIWARRLKRCAEDITDPRHAGRTIGDIAFSWGFNDLTHFSRAFKARFGMSPKDYRHQRRLNA